MLAINNVLAISLFNGFCSIKMLQRKFCGRPRINYFHIIKVYELHHANYYKKENGWNPDTKIFFFVVLFKKII